MHGIKAAIKNAVRKGLEHAAVTSIFALLLTTIIVASSASGFYPVKVLERWGTDFGMRMNTHLISKREPSNVPPYLFVDIDRSGCAAYQLRSKTKLEYQPECAKPGEPPIELLAFIIKQFSQNGAELIVLNYALTRKRRQLLLDSLYKARRPDSGTVHTTTIIVPFPVRPTGIAGRASAYGDWGPDDLTIFNELPSRETPSNETAQYRLLYASVASWSDGDIADGVIRNLPTVTRVDYRDKPGKFFFLPTAAFLAGMEIASETQADFEDLFYATGRKSPTAEVAPAAVAVEQDQKKGGSPSGRVLCGQIGELGGLKPSEQLTENEIRLRRLLGRDLTHLCGLEGVYTPVKSRSRIVYTIPSATVFKFRSIDNKSKNRPKYPQIYATENIYMHESLFSLIRINDASEPELALEDLALSARSSPSEQAGQTLVTVVGSSAPEAIDWHATPLGNMPGAEILINGMRAYADPGALILTESKGLTKKILWKLFFILIAGICVLCVMSLFKLLESMLKYGYKFLRISRMRPSPALLQIFVVVLEVSGWLLAGAAAIIATVYIGTLYLSTADVLEFDLLVPVAAVALETLIEASYVVLALIHRWLAPRNSEGE